MGNSLDCCHSSSVNNEAHDQSMEKLIIQYEKQNSMLTKKLHNQELVNHQLRDAVQLNQKESTLHSQNLTHIQHEMSQMKATLSELNNSNSSNNNKNSIDKPLIPFDTDYFDNNFAFFKSDDSSADSTPSPAPSPRSMISYKPPLRPNQTGTKSLKIQVSRARAQTTRSRTRVRAQSEARECIAQQKSHSHQSLPNTPTPKPVSKYLQRKKENKVEFLSKSQKMKLVKNGWYNLHEQNNAGDGDEELFGFEESPTQKLPTAILAMSVSMDSESYYSMKKKSNNNISIRRSKRSFKQRKISI